MIDKRRFITAFKSFSTYFSASLIPMALSLVANPFIAMNMSPEDYAITGYFTSFAPLITPLINFYFLQYYIKRYFEYDEIQRKELKAATYRLLIIYSFIVSIICFVVLSCYIHFYNTDTHFKIFPYLPLAILAIPITGLYGLELADFKMQRNSKSYFRLSVSVGVINTLILVMFVVVLKLGALGKLLAPVIAYTAIFIILLYRHSDLWKIKVPISYYKKMFIFCWPLAGGAMLGYFTNGYDKTYLESVGNINEYGIYCVGASMASYLHIFSSAISSTFQPDVYESIAKNDNRKLLKTFCAQLGSLSFIVILFIICCPLVVYVLTAGRYMASVPYTRIIAIATVTSVLYYNINCVTIAKGFPRLSLYTSIIGSALIVALMPIFVNKWQYNGGAWMNVFSYIMFFVVNMILLCFAFKKKKNKIRYQNS